jgi:hypothetical protein
MGEEQLEVKVIVAEGQMPLMIYLEELVARSILNQIKEVVIRI